MQASHPLRPSPRLPSARPRRAAHPLPRCTRSRHGRRPPRSPPLRAAGAQPRAGHLRIHHDEANGPNSDSAPRPGGRRVHLGSACWGGRRCASPLSGRPRGGGGRASGSNSLLVSRAAAAPFIRPLVMSFRFCIVSRPLASRGAPERHVYWVLAAGAERAVFNSQPTILYMDTLGGDTRRICDTSGWSWRWPSVVSRSTRSAESRGEARRAATLDSRRDSRGARPTLKSSKIRRGGAALHHGPPLRPSRPRPRLPHRPRHLALLVALPGACARPDAHRQVQGGQLAAGGGQE